MQDIHGNLERTHEFGRRRGARKIQQIYRGHEEVRRLQDDAQRSYYRHGAQIHEAITDMELRFTKLMGDLSDLGKELTEKEKNLKIIRGLPKSWDMKVIAMRDHRDMKTTSTNKIFSDLKACEFEHESKESEELEIRNVALVANQQASTSNRSTSNSCNFLFDEQYALFVRKMKRFMQKNNFQDFQRPSSRRQHERSSLPPRQETMDSQMLCCNCRKPGHFKANCPHPLASKHQDTGVIKSTSKESSESIKQSDKLETSNSRNEIRRKAMVVNETADNIETESSSSSLSSDDDGAEEENGLLCLFSEEEELNELCLMAQDEEVDSQSSSFLSLETSSTSDKNSNESVSEMMWKFTIINSTYSKLKEENSRLLISHNELRRFQIENIKLAIVKDQLEKQVLSLKEQCTEMEIWEQKLREILDSFNNSSNLMDRMVNGSKPLGERTGIGYDLGSSSHVALNKPTNVYTRESFKSAFIQGPTQVFEPVTRVYNGEVPQSTSLPKVTAVQRIVEPRNENSLKGNPRHKNAKWNGPKGNRSNLYQKKVQPTCNNQSRTKPNVNQR
ncbi:PREDICTED: uncharacterized protein LOC109172936 [Ipomoea nil]|uniref:uncharacterized protein LOC109172936 n=1 Tax=Ipomoea nil TaxID=35883 RepID=UPI000900B0D5|nr:PREDICTED: uncharacterized protein LOC109172936 [Ipomoea nil]